MANQPRTETGYEVVWQICAKVIVKFISEYRVELLKIPTPSYFAEVIMLCNQS